MTSTPEPTSEPTPEPKSRQGLPVTIAPDGDASVHEESPQVKIRRLEGLLNDSRRHAPKAMRQLHRTLTRELKAAEKRADAAEKQARAAERRAQRAEKDLSTARRRAERAEAEVREVRASATWRAGSAILAVPRRVRGLRRG